MRTFRSIMVGNFLTLLISGAVVAVALLARAQVEEREPVKVRVPDAGETARPDAES